MLCVSPFSELVEAWLQYLQANKGRSPATADQYLTYLMRLDAWCTSPPDEPHLRPSVDDARRVTREDLERFAGVVAHTGGLAPRSRRVMVSALRGFFTWAAATGKIAGNPAATLPYPKAGKPLPRQVTLQDAERMLMAAPVDTFLGLRDAAIMMCLAGLGCRVSGLCRLNESALVWIEEESEEVLYIRFTEKGERERIVPAPREAALMLRAYLGHRDLAAIDRSLPDGDQVLFVTTRNRQVPECDYHGEARRISPYAVRDLLLKYGRLAGVPEKLCHPHAFRHLYGTELEESDVSLKTNQALLGHEDIKSTTIYTRTAVRKLRAEVDRANPLAKMRAPILRDLRAIHAAERSGRAFTRPAARHKS